MEPVVLVHGYSAESSQDIPAQIRKIYGSLPKDLTEELGVKIDDVNISRYISLDDGVNLEDVTLAFDRVLRTQYPELLEPGGCGFNAIIHSTGALVLRNWVRRCSPRGADGKPLPSPCRRIIHLAGANLGSGWAHIGETQMAKWLRYIGQGGLERGMAVLKGLELGSNWAIDLHRYFLQPGASMLDDFQVMEFSIVGSQAPPSWMIIPFRYGKEDGSDGVVRVSASNLNHNYVRIGPVRPPAALDYQEAGDFAQRTVDASADGNLADFTLADSVFAGGYYEVKELSIPGIAPFRKVEPTSGSDTDRGGVSVTAGGGQTPTAEAGSATPQGPAALNAARPRPIIPFAIPYRCAHSTSEIGIVYGTETRQQLLALIGAALNCNDRGTYNELAERFADLTTDTYARVAHDEGIHIKSLLGIFEKAEQVVTNYLHNPEAQYDKHAQVIVRVRDQNGQAIDDCSIHFNSFGGGDVGTNGAAPKILIDSLFEDTHKNNASPDTTTFYLRLESWDGNLLARKWVDRLPDVNGVDLEIDSIDADTRRILFVPFRMRLSSEELAQYLRPHQTTIIDVELLRLPSRDTFSLYKNSFDSTAGATNNVTPAGTQGELGDSA